VHPQSGEIHWLILPRVDAKVFSLALSHFAEEPGAGKDKHILLVLDQAGWHDGPLLLIGLFADDPYPTIARLGVELTERKGRPHNRTELIEAYHGLPVPDLSLYVGFAQPEVLFDVPLLTTGLEHLYITLNPSPDLTERQLREIFYDHLVTRRAAPVDYDTLLPELRGL
jgi:hypothetical protein